MRNLRFGLSQKVFSLHGLLSQTSVKWLFHPLDLLGREGENEPVKSHDGRLLGALRRFGGHVHTVLYDFAHWEISSHNRQSTWVSPNTIQYMPENEVS